MGRERIQEVFTRSRAEGRTALLPYLTAGLPTPGESPALFEAMAAAGADAFEVGIPYADPLMDGPVIMRAGDEALRAGTTIERALEVVRRVADSTGCPLLAMTYANPVLRRGVEWFCRELAAAGADGIIVPDLPVEESGPLRAAAARHGLGVVLFAAPTSDEARLRQVAAADPVFVYGVAEMGVTGEREGVSPHLRRLAERVREVTDAPLVLGVGISTPEQARAAGEVADGVIVGTALVRRVLEAADPAAAAEALRVAVGELVAALR